MAAVSCPDSDEQGERTQSCLICSRTSVPSSGLVKYSSEPQIHSSSEFVTNHSKSIKNDLHTSQKKIIISARQKPNIPTSTV